MEFFISASFFYSCLFYFFSFFSKSFFLTILWSNSDGPGQIRLLCSPFWQSNFIKLFDGGLQHKFIPTFFPNSEEKYLVILKFLPQSVSLYIHWSIIMQDQGCCPCDARSQDRENSHFFGLSVCSVAQLLEREGGSFGPQEMACSTSYIGRIHLPCYKTLTKN